MPSFLAITVVIFIVRACGVSAISPQKIGFKLTEMNFVYLDSSGVAGCAIEIAANQASKTAWNK